MRSCIRGVLSLLVLFLSVQVSAAEEAVFLLSKRQIVASNHTLAVFFYDRSVTNLAECQREIQRGIRNQWRYYTHQFPRPVGYAENRDYLCLQTTQRLAAYYDKAPYDFVYQIDLRGPAPKIRRMENYALCLGDLRRHVEDEQRLFFCARASQRLL